MLIGFAVLTAQAGGSLTFTSAATTTAVTVSPNPATLGQTVTLKATVTSSAGTPSGSVSFYADGTLLTSAMLNGSGIASVTTSSAGQSAGSYSITAVYAGNSSFSGSTSPVYTFTLKKATPTVTVSAKPEPVTCGQSVTLKATVASAGATPTGELAFSSSGVVLIRANVSGGVATVTVPTDGYAPASYSIVGAYQGSSNFNSASSSAYTLQLEKAPTSTTLVISPSTVTPPNSVTLTATVARTAAGASGKPAGSVSFSLAGSTIGSATLNNAGVATLTASTAGFTAGTYSIVAAYSGDTYDAKSTASPVSVSVTSTTAFAYTLNSNLNTTGLGNISGYKAASGALTLLNNSPFSTQLTTPIALAVDAPMNLLFVAGGSGGDQSTGSIAAFSINPANGNLTAATVTTPSDPPTFLLVDPSGKFLYVSHHDTATISAYSIESGGALKEISGSPFSLPGVNCGLFCPASADLMVYSSAAAALYVTSNTAWVVATFTADPTTGALAFVYNEPTSGPPTSVTVDPSGTYVYAPSVSNVGGVGKLSAWLVTTDSVVNNTPQPLTPLAGSPFATVDSPSGSVIEPTGHFLYVLSQSDNTIAIYQLGSGGIPTAVGDPVAITGGTTDAVQVTTDGAGKYLYVDSQQYDGGSRGGISAFSISGTGTLTQLESSPYSPGSNAEAPLQVGIYQPE